MGTIISILTGGAGGGILGSVIGLFKHRQEAKEKIELEELRLKRDKEDARAAKEERAHELAMHQAGAAANLAQTEAEVEGEIDVANQGALKEAVTVEFSGLKTSAKMDNYRASVRPTLTYLFTFIFMIILFWAFRKFSPSISVDQGNEILLGLFATLEFMVTSFGSFYFAARRRQ